MPDLGQQLRRYLDATTVPVDAEPAADRFDEEVMPLLEERPTRRPTRIGLLVAAAAITIAGTVGILTLRDNDDAITVDTVDEPNLIGPGPAPAPRPSGVLGEDLIWELGPLPDDPSGFVMLLSDGKTFYWIGNTLYSSGDGQAWAEVDFGDGPSPSLLSTGVAHGVFAGQMVSSSAAGSSVLVELVGIDGSIRSSSLSPEIADGGPPTMIVDIDDARATIGPRGTVVTAQLVVRDLGPLVEDVLGVDAASVIAVRPVAQVEDETFEIELPSGTETVRLLDHGIEDSHELEVAPSGPVGWHSADGVTWTPVAGGPFATGGPRETIVTATTSGFVATGARNWFSADGVSWDELGDPTAPLCCEAGVAWNGQALIRGADDSLQAVSDQGVTTLPLADAGIPSRYSRSMGAGEVGIAYLVDVDPDIATFDIVYSPDGISWKRQPLPAGIGELYCCYLDVYGVVVGITRVAVLADGGDGLELWLGAPTSEDER